MKKVKVELLNEGGFTWTGPVEFPCATKGFISDDGRGVMCEIANMKADCGQAPKRTTKWAVFYLGSECRIIEEKRRRIDLGANAEMFDYLTMGMEDSSNSDKLAFILREAKVNGANIALIDEQHELILKLRSELCGLLAENSKLKKEVSDRKIAYKALADYVAGEE